MARALPGEADALVFDGTLDALGTTWTTTEGERGGGSTVTSEIEGSPDPPLIDFGFVELGTTTTAEVTISNVGTAELKVLDLFISMMTILAKLITTSGTFFPIYVSDLPRTANLFFIDTWANNCKIHKKLAQELSGTDLGITQALESRGVCRLNSLKGFGGV